MVPTQLAFDAAAGQHLQAAQAQIAWAGHLVWVYPTWWGAMPALLKGFIDRVFLPGFAFKHHQGSSRWDKLLAGRSAELLVTMDTPPWYYRWVQRGPGHHQIVLELADLLALDDVAFRQVFSGSPIKRIGRNRMVRNVAIAAGNSGDRALIPALQALVKDADETVREAAAWALAEFSASAAAR